MSEMTLAEMAREIERRRKNTLPKSLRFDAGVKIGRPQSKVEMLTFSRMGAWNQDVDVWIPDDLAHSILRDAMVMETKEIRDENGWWVDDPSGSWFDKFFADADHGGCPTRSLFAAFCAVFPEPESADDMRA